MCSSTRRRRVKAQEEQQAPPGPEMASTASRSAAAQQCSAKRLTRDTEVLNTTQDGLSQRRRSYGSEPRREDRDESALRADDGNVGKT